MQKLEITRRGNICRNTINPNLPQRLPPPHQIIFKSLHTQALREIRSKRRFAFHPLRGIWLVPQKVPGIVFFENVVRIDFFLFVL